MKDRRDTGSCSPEQPSVPVSVHFAVTGDICYVSHAEMLRIFQRAFARARIPLTHSRGFNPRPKLSLPLPRSVGVESESELLQIRVDLASCSQDTANSLQSALDTDSIMQRLGEQLPDGCVPTSVVAGTSAAPSQPCSAAYILTVSPDFHGDDLEDRVRSVLESESLEVERRSAGRGRQSKRINVRGFIKSIELKDGAIVVECSIGPQGTIRVEEILAILGLSPDALAAPVRRTNVQWLNN